VSLASREVTSELTLLLFSFLSVHDFCEGRTLLELINEHRNDLATAKANHGYGIHGLMEMEYDMFFGQQAMESTIRWGGRVLVLLTIVVRRKSVMTMVDRYRKHVCVCSCEGKIRNKRSSSISLEKIVNEHI
jgi:hypothetical protein